MTITGNMLKGLAIVVTGAGNGIGRACASGLAALGAQVVVNDIDSERAASTADEINTSGGAAVPHAADIASHNAALRLMERCINEFGQIDGLVNNAALISNGTIEEYDPDDFQRLLSVNVVGLANCGTAALTHMLSRGSGSVVNITSGAHLGMQHLGLYGATKGAVSSLTYTWALEARDRGVRVNGVSPWAASGMSDVTDAYRAARGLPLESSGFPDPNSNTPAIAYLLSAASTHVTGQLLRIQDRQLSLMTHPSVMTPILERPTGWDVEEVGRAFEEHFALRHAPVGMGYGDPATSVKPATIPF